MCGPISHNELHRTAKYFMDSGRAGTHREAMDLLHSFGLSVYVGEKVSESVAHQTALLTLVNVARRTFLGGIDVVGLVDAPCLTPLGSDASLRQSAEMLGGQLVDRPRPGLPSALIGTARASSTGAPCWQLTWEGWRGGVVAGLHEPLEEETSVSLAPAVAAAACAAEAFAYFAGDNPMAGRRSQGLSLWRPGIDWLVHDTTEPALLYLPARLWLIGLGNLGQAYAWLLASLPYEDRGRVELVLQDFDRIASSNDSTSVLSFERDIGRMKTRIVSEWLEGRGFETCLVERRFGSWTSRDEHEPGSALCGVDNADARTALDKAGFDLVVEAGLGAGPQAFRSISMHTFPAERTAAEVWSGRTDSATDGIQDMPAYRALERDGIDDCGLTQLSSRTVGVPFVGVVAGCLVISELLRRLHGGGAAEIISTSAAALGDIEFVGAEPAPFDSGFVTTSAA